MKKRVLASVLACAMAFHILSPLEKVTPEETASDHSIDRVTGSSSSPQYGQQTPEPITTDSWDEIASLSLAEQLALSQFAPITGDTVILGSAEAPFLLSNVAQLLELGDYVYDGNEDFNAAHYKLTQDVSLSSVENWTAIGDSTNKFQGSFDGDGHVISNMTISNPSASYQGFFGYTEGATIKNLGIENYDVNCYERLGGLVGRADTTTIVNCYATGIVTGGGNEGGLVGYAVGSDITNCYATGTLRIYGGNGGGLVGYFQDGTISNCYATGAVVGIGDNMGGLVGGASNATIENSVALNPNVSGESNVNRLLGSGSVTLSDSYAWDGMGISAGKVGGEAGTDLTYTSGTLSPQFIAVFGSGNTAWNFATDKLPTLKDVGGNQSSDIPYYMNNTATDIYISTVPQLQALAQEVNGGNDKSNVTYILMNDLDMTGVEWEAIGNSTTQFKGTFDGNGYVISNLTITGTDDNQGLFGYVNGATIQNLGVVDCDVSGNMYVGGLVGFADTTKTNITNCYTTGTVKGSQGVGGLMGWAQDTKISNCYATGSVSTVSYYIGGLVGRANGVSIENCYATGSVLGNDFNASGLVGYAYGGSIKNSVALNPSISGNSDVYRVVGLNEPTDLSDLANNYAWKDMTVDGSARTSTDTASLDGADLTYSSPTLSPQLETIFSNNSAWTYSENGLPILANVGGNQSSALPSHITSTAVVDNPIYTVADLQALADWVNAFSSNDTSGKTYTLMNDLDLSGVEWTPIGSSGRTFKGIFDGNGKVISNLTITGTNSYQGLFGETEGAEIKNLGIENCSVTGGWYTSGLVAIASNTNIEKCYVTGMVSGNARTSGLVGQSSSSLTISNCYVTATVSGSSQMGGLIGFVYGTVTIQNCYVTGAVTGSGSPVGGLVAGTSTDASLTITNSLALNPSVKGGSSVGRVVGNSTSTTLANNYAWKDM